MTLRSHSAWTVLLASSVAVAQGKPPSMPPSGDEEGSGSARSNPATDDEKKLYDAALPLVRRGVASGGSFVLQLPTPWDAGTTVERVAASPVIYVGVLPGSLYHHDEHEVNAYCATGKTAEDREHAERAAIKRALHRTAPVAELSQPDRALVEERTGWVVGEDPGCGFWRYVGFSVNLTTSFWNDVERNGRRQNVEVHPIAGVGFIVAPVPWLHFLVGVTLSNAATGDPPLNHLATSPYIGVAVPIDVMARFLR